MKSENLYKQLTKVHSNALNEIKKFMKDKIEISFDIVGVDESGDDILGISYYEEGELFLHTENSFGGYPIYQADVTVLIDIVRQIEEEEYSIVVGDYDFILDYGDLKNLYYEEYVSDEKDFVRLYFKGKYLGFMKIHFDSEEDDRKYIVINNEVIYLDTLNHQ